MRLQTQQLTLLIDNDIVQSINLVSEVTSSERRDWSVSNTIQLLPTNERQVQREIVIGDMDNGSAVTTDLIRRESWR